ncbi:hypothetical protein QUF72_20450 [Desulfobacterales bacterium HSG2]|nr:hypothetical protein [Desulfobacterales bacterium HSG2]
MNTQKIAITIPGELIISIDKFSREQGISGSKYVSRILQEKISEEERRGIKNAYDTVFSDESVCREQLETAAWFDNMEDKEGPQNENTYYKNWPDYNGFRGGYETTKDTNGHESVGNMTIEGDLKGPETANDTNERESHGSVSIRVHSRSFAV